MEFLKEFGIGLFLISALMATFYAWTKDVHGVLAATIFIGISALIVGYAEKDEVGP